MTRAQLQKPLWVRRAVVCFTSWKIFHGVGSGKKLSALVEIIILKWYIFDKLCLLKMIAGDIFVILLLIECIPKLS